MSESASPAGSTEQRRATLFAALALGQLDVVPGREPAVDALKTYLDSWCGAGDVVRGMLRHGYSIDMSATPETEWAVVLMRDKPSGGSEIVASAHEASLPKAVQVASWNALIGKPVPGGRSVGRSGTAAPHE